MELLSNCPVCNGAVFKDHLVCRDNTVSKKDFTIQACQSCGFLFTNPRPNQAEIGPFYESSDYISHSNAKKGLFNQVYQQVRNIAIKNKISLIQHVTGKTRPDLLDVGCGTGEFLAGCQKNGWKVVGVEPGEIARKQAISNHQLHVEEEGYLAKTENTFDVITLWHVLEHVHSLNERILQLKKLLRKDGVLIIAVPNPTSKDALLFGKNWAAWDVPRHLYHFSPESLKRLMAKNGFSHKKSFPMKFDAYYVSLLSAGYERGKKQDFRGLLSGLTSNLAAGRNAEKYSSVIYSFVHTN